MLIPSLRYLAFWPVSLLAVWVACVLAPIAALPIFVRSHSPKGVYGDPREGEWLSQGWAWITTHDAHVDQYAYSSMGQRHWLLKRYDRDNPASNPGWLRYANRVLWIWRNPAYYTKHHWLGFDTTGTADAYTKGVRFGAQTNERGQVGFLYERRFRYLHIQFGWKLYRSDPDGKRMYAFRVKPELRPGWS